jgi:hypothetical protein
MKLGEIMFDEYSIVSDNLPKVFARLDSNSTARLYIHDDLLTRKNLYFFSELEDKDSYLSISILGEHLSPIWGTDVDIKGYRISGYSDLISINKAMLLLNFVFPDCFAYSVPDVQKLDIILPKS